MSAADTTGWGDIAVCGLGVMGENLILNLATHGFKVVVTNRTVSKIDVFFEENKTNKTLTDADRANLRKAESIEDAVRQLKKPRKIFFLVHADHLESTMKQYGAFLEKGDILIDGGNSLYTNSNRLDQEYAKDPKGILFVGCGVSGGEEGARYGPSMMPSGSAQAWDSLEPILTAISAKHIVKGKNGEKDQEFPCATWIGDGGSGHFVKMVHNGIEYGDMQIIAEAFQYMRTTLDMSIPEIAEVFDEWDRGVLGSFLINITAKILQIPAFIVPSEDERKVDLKKFKKLYPNAKGPEDLGPNDPVPYVEKWMVDDIEDAAGQKGTGKWTAIASMEYGMPLTLISEAVYSRFLSSLQDIRKKASTIIPPPPTPKDVVLPEKRKEYLDDLRDAVYAAKIISYAQGFMLIQETAKKHEWKLNIGAIAAIWREGCIIKSVFLNDITRAYQKKHDLENLLFDDFFADAINRGQLGFRQSVARAAIFGVSMPAISSALSYLDGFRTDYLPTALIQAQRDFFGSHTFLVRDGHRPAGPKFEKDGKAIPIHVPWAKQYEKLTEAKAAAKN